MADVEHFTMPNGSVVHYKPVQHSYWTDYDEKKDTCSGRIPGISTISKHDGESNKDGLLDWAARLTCDGVARCVTDGEDWSFMDWLNTGDTIAAELKSSGATWRQMRDKAGVRGQVSHNVLQQLSEGVTPAFRSGYDKAVISWWKARRPEPLNVEQVVYSAKEGFAGRFDLRARTADGLIALVDLKTSGYISNAFHIQLQGYEVAAQECGIGASDRQLVLQVKEDGTWQEWECRANPGDFLTALDAYRMGKRISSAARKDWKAMKQGVAA